MKDTPFYIKKTLNFGGNLYSINRPQIIGILNITPDSFYPGSRVNSKEDILLKAKNLTDGGADILDIGGYSSRPGAEQISEQEELGRVIPAIKFLRTRLEGIRLSVDTFRSGVASEAIQAGAVMVNDISGGELDQNMFDVVAKFQVPYVLMHMRGNPGTMSDLTDYVDPVSEIAIYFSRKISILRSRGISDIILDPGFGFAKTMDQNYEILRNLRFFGYLGLPLMVGISRKSMIYKKLKISSEEALNGTTVLHTWALLNQASFLRVHDCREAMEAVSLLNNLLK